MLFICTFEKLVTNQNIMNAYIKYMMKNDLNGLHFLQDSSLKRQQSLQRKS